MDLLTRQPLRHRALGRLMPLARSDNGELVPRAIKAVDQPAQRHRDTVDFRNVSFSNEGEMQ